MTACSHFHKTHIAGKCPWCGNLCFEDKAKSEIIEFGIVDEYVELLKFMLQTLVAVGEGVFVDPTMSLNSIIDLLQNEAVRLDRARTIFQLPDEQQPTTEQLKAAALQTVMESIRNDFKIQGNKTGKD